MPIVRRKKRKSQRESRKSISISTPLFKIRSMVQLLINLEETKILHNSKVKSNLFIKLLRIILQHTLAMPNHQSLLSHLVTSETNRYQFVIKVKIPKEEVF